MAVYLLTNTVGSRATSATIQTGSLVAGYSALDAISGPRNRTVRGEAGIASHRFLYECPSTTVTHAVVSRMDLFKNTLDADHVQLQYGAGYTTDSTTQVEDLELIGPTGQDWVQPIERNSSAFSLLLNSAETTREYEYGKVYFSAAFSFGEEPDLGPKLSFGRTEPVQFARSVMGYAPYAVEAGFELSFPDVSLAKLLEFETLPLDAPFFVYDDTGDVIVHQLEHVLLAAPWSWQRVGDDEFNIRLSLARLAHYL